MNEKGESIIMTWAWAGCGIVNFFAEIVLDRAINFKLRYSGARQLRDLKTIKALNSGYHVEY